MGHYSVLQMTFPAMIPENRMNLKIRTFFAVLVAILILSFAAASQTQQWIALGPDGGNVRSLAYDPHNPDHIFLGTSSGQVFASQDGGSSWTRFSHFGGDEDYAIDHFIVDPRDPSVMYAAAWSVSGQIHGSDVFKTTDGGKTWGPLPDMHDKSVRALAQSVSDPDVLVAGALDGVYRTNDAGKSWHRISPANHAEMKNFESVAVDPRNPNVIYAGTWHLPWKTEDGGNNWHPIKKGMIDDSDVFSLIVDRDASSVVYASACSGIYKSEQAGELFHKIQGIPFEARRTRVLKQDPGNPSIVYAGTTEGLWRTEDAGKTWKRVTDSSVLVNDVLVDPRQSSRVLLATDRSGVLASNDFGRNFRASNHGFAHRQVASVIADRKDANTIYVGMTNDRDFGGVFVSHDNGAHWQQLSGGLGGRDVFALQQTRSGELVAGTNHGVFVLDGGSWEPANTVVKEVTHTKVVRVSSKSKKTKKVETHSIERAQMDWRVFDVDAASSRWIAATTEGLFTSTDQGKTWHGGAVLGQKNFISVRANGDVVAAASHSTVALSSDGGSTWTISQIPSYVTRVSEAAIGPDSSIWLATQQGALHSTDIGKTWQHVMNGLPPKYVSDITYDETGKRLLAGSVASGEIFESTDMGQSWHTTGFAGYPVVDVAVIHGRVLAATPFDGIVEQPSREAHSPAHAGNNPTTGGTTQP